MLSAISTVSEHGLCDRWPVQINNDERQLLFTPLEANRNLLTAMSLLRESIHWCRRYPTRFNSGRDIPRG